MFLITREELLDLISAYNSGKISFAEVLLASGKTVKELCQFLKTEGIQLSFNVNFLQEGRGLNEDDLNTILESQ